MLNALLKPLLKLLKGAIAPCFFLLASQVASATTEFDGPWLQCKNDEYLLITDVSKKKAEKLANELTTFRVVVSQLLSIDTRRKTRPLKILITDNHKIYSLIKPEGNAIGFYTTSGYENWIIVGPEKYTTSLSEVLFHEYIHYLLYSYSNVRYPSWYHEGVASLFSSLEISDKKIVLGKPPESMIESIRRNKEQDINLLLKRHARHGRAETSWRFYTNAWAFTHFLFLNHVYNDTNYSKPLQDYLKYFNDGLTSKDAFEKAFEDDHKMLSRKIEKYLNRRLPTLNIKLRKVKQSPCIESLDKHEAMFEIASLVGRRESKTDEAREILEALFAEDKNNARALSRLSIIEGHEKNYQKSLSTCNELAASADTVVIANCLHTYFDYLSDPEISKDPTSQYTNVKNRIYKYSDKLAELDPLSPEPYIYAGVVQHMVDRQTVPGVKKLMKALQLNPSSIDINFKIGVILADTPRADLAVEFLEKAASWGHGGEVSKKAGKLLDDIEIQKKLESAH